jgi:hypothetical protein
MSLLDTATTLFKSIIGGNYSTVYVTSTVDGKQYKVRDMPDKQAAADLMAKLRIRLTKLCNILEQKYPDKPQVKLMIKNLGGENVEKYLSRQKYRTVSSQEFSDEFNLGVGSQSPEVGKKIALTDYIHNVVKATNKLVNDEKYTKISVGFSDDDLGNIKAVEEIIREELQKKFPDINFVIYDTSDPKNIKKKRIFIKK